MLICPKCGREMADGVSSCPQCGVAGVSVAVPGAGGKTIDIGDKATHIGTVIIGGQPAEEKRPLPLYCGIGRHRISDGEASQCPRCFIPVCKDHLDADTGWCQRCGTQYREGFVNKLDKENVVVSQAGTVMTQQDFGTLLLDRERLKTASGESVATIKKNVWYARQWYEMRPPRYKVEVEVMERFYPQMCLNTAEDGTLYWQGPLATFKGNQYEVQIRYPAVFPYEAPRAYIVKPKISESRHIYKDGHLCLFHPDHRTWAPKTTAATVVSWVALWLHCYEAWRDTGNWPRREVDQVVTRPEY